MSNEKSPFEGWAIIELMGHRRLGGYVSEVTFAGAAFVRIDIPGEDGKPAATQLVSPGSVYALTPTTEAIARAVAARNQPAPVQRWELPQLTAEPVPAGGVSDDDDYHDDDFGDR